MPEAGFPLGLIDVGRSKTYRSSTRLRTLARLPEASPHCKRLIREFGPARCWAWADTPPARRWRRRFGSRFPPWPLSPMPCPALPTAWWEKVQAAAVNFPAAAKWFRNAEVTGVPVRPEFFSLPAA